MTQASNLWSQEEIDFLTAKFDELTTAQLAQVLERSMGSIRVQACRLNLSARNGREKAFNRRKLEVERSAFLKNPCMVTPSSRVGDYWPRYLTPL
jgi:hypothetical protein